MERKFLFNYSILDKYITESQKDRDRSDGEITILRDNIKKNLCDTSYNQNEFIITINENTREITINGQKDLQDKFYMIPTGFEMDNKSRLYRQIKLSMERVKKHGIYDEIFREIENDNE